MKKILSIYMLLVLFIFSSCERLIMAPDPDTDPVSVFNEFTTVFREKYAMFEAKGVNWDSLYAVELETLQKSPSEYNLMMAVFRMVWALKDGHTSVTFNDGGGVGYPIDFVRIDTIAPDSFEVIFQPYCYDTTEAVISNYLTLSTKTDGLDYGLIGDSVGYIRYRDFEKEVTDEQMNEILREFKNSSGLIMDVRGNGGGDPAIASMMASHFTTERRYAGYENFKVGPGKNDFRKSDMYTRVASGEIYSKPVVMLVDIGCYSATTTLHYLSRPNDHVILLGDTTGGGSGSVFDNELSNGWTYSLSTSEYITHDNLHIDNGIIPDIVVVDTLFDDGDALIDSALAYISRQ